MRVLLMTLLRKRHEGNQSPRELLEVFSDPLTKDYIHPLRNGDRARAQSADEAMQLLLIDLSVTAHSYNSNMTAFGLPDAADASATATAIAAAHVGVGSPDHNSELCAAVAANIANFPEQQAILDTCMAHITARRESMAAGATGTLLMGICASDTNASLVR